MARGFNAFMRHIRDEQADTMISFRSTEPPSLAKGLLACFASVILFIIAGYIAADQHNFLSHAQKAPGIVKSLNAGGSHPEIEFTSSSGQVVSFPQGGLISGYEPGQAVEVFYNAEDPSLSPVISGPGAVWGGTGFAGLIGLGLLIVGACEVFSWRKEARRFSAK